MSDIRVWLPAPGVVLAHRDEGCPTPPIDHDARAALDPPVSQWPWRRKEVWPCQGIDDADEQNPGRPFGYCQRLAVWRISDSRTHGCYCPAHAYVKLAGPPVELCTVCTGPLDPVLTAAGESTHPCCDPTSSPHVERSHDEALALLHANSQTPKPSRQPRRNRRTT
jgi:hypothetical protein